MSNNYLEFSEVIENLTPEEFQWWEKQCEPTLAAQDAWEELNSIPMTSDGMTEENWKQFQAKTSMKDIWQWFEKEFDISAAEMMKIDDEVYTTGEDNRCTDFELNKIDNLVWFHADECGDPDAVAAVVQEFLCKFRPKECFSLTWACWCSKPRIGEFDGGAMFVTAKETKFCSPCQWMSDRQKEWDKTMESKTNDTNK